MIADMLPAPHRAIDPGRDQATGNRWAQQQVIDAQPGIAGKRVPEIFPEGVRDPSAVPEILANHVFDRELYLPGLRLAGTDGLLDSPLEGSGFELPVPVRQAKLTRSCR